MVNDPLAALVRVRRLALDEARRRLADCLAAEERAARALSQGEAEIVLERAAASRPDGGDATVEAFAAWLRVARLRAAQDSAALERSSTEAARARAIVAVARGSLEAAEAAQERQAEDRRRAREARDQLGLEDAARERPDEPGARIGDMAADDVLNTPMLNDPRNIRRA